MSNLTKELDSDCSVTKGRDAVDLVLRPREKGIDIPEHAMAILSNASGVIVEAAEESRIAIIGGEHMGKRFIDWNFVSSRKERIEQAKRDWRERRFPVVAGDEVEFIPLPQ